MPDTQLSVNRSPFVVGTKVTDLLVGDTYEVTEEFLTENGNVVVLTLACNYGDDIEREMSEKLGVGVGTTAYFPPILLTEAAK